MKKISGLTCILMLTVGLSLTLSKDNQIAQPQDNTSDSSSRQLHVIVFESMNDQIGNSGDHYRSIDLSSANLPLRLTKLFLPSSASTKVTLNDLGIRGDLTILDIYTFKPSEKEIHKANKFKRKNQLMKLDYSLKFLNWTDDFCRIELSGKRNKSFAPVTMQLSRKTTTLFQIDKPCLCFAFTFIDAAMRSDDVLQLTKRPDSEKNIINPVPKKQPLPQYPPELKKAGAEGPFRYLTIINEQGRIDNTHGIILECIHYLFARNALKVIVNDWEFTPGQVEGHPVPIIGRIEVDYQLWQWLP